jgi:hypothetical protein
MDKINTNYKGWQLLEDIKGLAQSQGSYGRMLQSLYDRYGCEANIEKALDEYIYQTHCKDILDFIMDMEG